MNLDQLTFLMAYVAYFFISVCMLAQVAKKESILKWAAPALLIAATIHVLMVWDVRYHFVPEEGLRNGVGTAVFFHTLYLVVISYTFWRKQHTFFAALIYPAWLVVSLGGTSSTFSEQFQILSFLQIPMVSTGILTLIGLIYLLWRNRKLRRKVANA